MDNATILRELVDHAAGVVLLAVESGGGKAGLEEVAAVLDGDRSHAARVASQLRQLGLVDPRPSMVMEVTLTAEGRWMAKEVRESRANGEARADKVEHGLLTWLAGGGHPASVLDFVGEPSATAYGVPFTEDEVQDASDFLTEAGYIQSFGAWGLTSGLRPEITIQGKRAARANVPLSGKHSTGAIHTSSYDYSNTTTITGGSQGAVQTGGSGNELQVQMTFTAEQRTHVIASISDLIQQLNNSELDDPALIQSLEEVQNEATMNDSTSESIKSKVVTAIATAGASEGAQFLLQGLAGVLGMVSGIT